MRQYTLLFICLFLINTISAQESKPDIALTTMTFEETTFNFGEIDEGERIQNVFSFTNTGDAPLMITNARGSCGCTVPEWPKAPIMPGESSYLIVEFNSKNKKGLQNKRVTLTANTNPAQSFLLIKGEIINDKEEHEPHESFTYKEGQVMPYQLDGENSITNISLYPNPTHDYITVSLADHVGAAAQIDVYNSLGERMLSKQLDKLTADTQLDIQNFTSGTYVVSIKVAGMHRIAKQFVVLDN